MEVKHSTLTLFLLFCCAAVLAQRSPLGRDPSRPTLVDDKSGYRPLFRSSDETRRRNGTYIIKLKEKTQFQDLGRIMARLTDQDQDPKDDAQVQGLSGYSMVGLGVMATLNEKALDSVSTITSFLQSAFHEAFHACLHCYPDYNCYCYCRLDKTLRSIMSRKIKLLRSVVVNLGTQIALIKQIFLWMRDSVLPMKEKPQISTSSTLA